MAGRDVFFREDIRNAIMAAALSGSSLAHVLDRFVEIESVPTAELVIDVYKEGYAAALRTIALNFGIELDMYVEQGIDKRL